MLATSAANEVSKRPLFVAATLFSVIGLVGSVLLMLYGFRRNPSIFLLCIFVIWVSSPFVAMLVVNRLVQRLRNFPHTTLQLVMMIVSVCSLALYAKHTLTTPLSAKFGFPFIVFPFVSWLFAIVVVGLVAAFGNLTKRSDML